jgi:hypothetical protein
MIATAYLMDVESSISCSLALPTDPEAADFIVDFELLQARIKRAMETILPPKFSRYWRHHF